MPNYAELAKQFGGTVVQEKNELSKRVDSSIDYASLAESFGGISQQPSVPQKGFFRTLGEEIVKRIAPLGVSVFGTGRATKEVLKEIPSYIKTGKLDVTRAEEELDKPRELPFVGKTEPAFTGDETVLDFTKKVTGYGLEIGSYLPFGLGAKKVAELTLKGSIIKGLKVGAKEGVIGGTMAGAAKPLVETKGADEMLWGAVTGGLTGGVFGGALGGFLPIPSAGFKAIRFAVAPTLKQLDEKLPGMLEKAIRPSVKRTYQQMKQYYNRASEAVKTIVENKNNLTFTDEAGQQIKRLPESLKDFSKAIQDTKKIIFRIYDGLTKATGQLGARVELNPIAKQLDNVASSKVLRDIKPDIANYASEKADILRKRGFYTPEETQEAIKIFNDSLDAFYSNPNYDNASKVIIDASIVNNLRKALDDVVDNFTGKDYQILKNKYGALKEIERDVTRRAMVEGRKAVKGLIDYSDIFSGGQIINGILSLNPGLLAQGITQKGIMTLFKKLNDPNRMIRRMFKETDKVIERNKVAPQLKKPPLLLPPGRTKVPTTSVIQLPSRGILEGRRNIAPTTIVPSKSGIIKLPKKPPTEAAGAIAGIEYERDEQGNITGVRYNPTKGALGVAGLTAGKKLPLLFDKVSERKTPKLIKNIADESNYMIDEKYVNALNKKYKGSPELIHITDINALPEIIKSNGLREGSYFSVGDRFSFQGPYMPDENDMIRIKAKVPLEDIKNWTPDPEIHPEPDGHLIDNLEYFKFTPNTSAIIKSNKLDLNNIISIERYNTKTGDFDIAPDLMGMLSILDEKKVFQGLPNLSTRLLEKFRGMPEEITPQQFNEVINKAQKEGIKKADLDMVKEAAERQMGFGHEYVEKNISRGLSDEDAFKQDMLFHGTRTDLDNIRKYGLLPNDQGGRIGKAVFFTKRFDEAEQYGGTILKINWERLKGDPRKLFDLDVGGDTIARKRIPAEALDVLQDDDTWVPLLSKDKLSLTKTPPFEGQKLYTIAEDRPKIEQYIQKEWGGKIPNDELVDLGTANDMIANAKAKSIFKDVLDTQVVLTEKFERPTIQGQIGKLPNDKLQIQIRRDLTDEQFNRALTEELLHALRIKKGRTNFDAEQLLNYLERPTEKSAKEGVKKLLGEEFFGLPVTRLPNKLSLPQLAKDIEKQLVPLTATPVKSPRYSSVGEDFIGDGKYGEIVYQSPIKTSAGDIHFPVQLRRGGAQAFDNYFSHVREELMSDGKGAKLLETQSDLFQKENFARELESSPELQNRSSRITRTNFNQEQNKMLNERRFLASFNAIKKNPEKYFSEPELQIVKENIADAQKTEKEFYDFIKKSGSYDNLTKEQLKTRNILEELKNKKNNEVNQVIWREMKSLNTKNIRILELSKLQPYYSNDPLAHLRTFREWIRDKAKQGRTYALTPTGETAMKIEGLGSSQIWAIGTAEGRTPDIIGQLTTNNMRVGLNVINEAGGLFEEWIITDVLGEGRFKAVPKRNWGFNPIERIKELNKQGLNAEANILERDIDNYGETHDISGKIDTKHFVYKLNEEAIPKEARKQGLIVEGKVKQDNGEWWRIKIPKERARMPVEAFGVLPFLPVRRREREE